MRTPCPRALFFRGLLMSSISNVRGEREAHLGVSRAQGPLAGVGWREKRKRGRGGRGGRGGGWITHHGIMSWFLFASASLFCLSSLFSILPLHFPFSFSFSFLFLPSCLPSPCFTLSLFSWVQLPFAHPPTLLHCSLSLSLWHSVFLILLRLTLSSIAGLLTDPLEILTITRSVSQTHAFAQTPFLLVTPVPGRCM